MSANKYERFEVRVVARGDIAGVEYNPRVISAAALGALKRYIKSPQGGLLAPLVWNEVTGNLVSGHQRLEILDQLHKGAPYQLTVAAVRKEGKEEVQANLIMNSTDAQGSWDAEKLQEVRGLFDLSNDDFEFAGFFEETLAMCGLLDEEVVEPEEPGEPEEPPKKFLADIAKKSREEFKTRNQDGDGSEYSMADYTVTVIFESAEKKRAWLRDLCVDENQTRILSHQLEL